MFRAWGRVSFFLVAVSLCLATVAQVNGQEKMSSRGSKAAASIEKTSKSTKGKTTRNSGRLPRYFASLVDDEQRQEIYKIQASYREKIEELEAELAKLEVAQMSEIEEVLTATQLKKLSGLREDAAASSAPKSAAKASTSKASTSKAKSANAKRSTTSTSAKPASSSSKSTRKSSKK